MTDSLKHGAKHPLIDGLFWDANEKKWVRHLDQKHAGVPWTGGPPK